MNTGMFIGFIAGIISLQLQLMPGILVECGTSKG
jgi:hypothetical protein